MAPLLLLLACTGDASLNKGEPRLELVPAQIDFDEVVVGHRSEIGVTVRNAGYGQLTFESVRTADLSSPDFEVVNWPGEPLGHGEEGVVGVRYEPDVEGQDFGEVEILSTDTLAPEGTVLPLEGTGVAPQADVDPELLWFGTLPDGASSTLPVHVSAGGSGRLMVTSIGFPEDEGLAYSYALPEGWTEPYPVEQGLGFTVDVTFTPPSTDAWEGELWITTNSPDAPLSVVRLRGNVPDDPTTNETPEVEIVDPNNGEFLLDDQGYLLLGQVVDPDEPLTNLLCGWYAGGTAVAVAMPDAEGAIVSTATLPAGESVELELRCVDSEGAVGSDVVTVTVWEAEEPMTYTVSGGNSVFDWITVDDDLSLELNGVEVYADNDGTQSNLPPIELYAEIGDTLRVILVDENACDAALDALVLHWGTGSRQALNDGYCISSCPDHACYDASYAGPWPGVVFEGEYVVSIP